MIDKSIYRETLEKRAQVMINAKDANVQAMIMEKCRRDILFWFDLFAFTDKNS